MSLKVVNTLPLLFYIFGNVALLHVRDNQSTLPRFDETVIATSLFCLFCFCSRTQYQYVNYRFFRIFFCLGGGRGYRRKRARKEENRCLEKKRRKKITDALVGHPSPFGDSSRKWGEDGRPR